MTAQEYTLPPPTADCQTDGCRRRKAERIARYAPINDPVAALEKHEREQARMALTRFSRQELTEGELLAEVEALERQVIYLSTFAPSEKQIAAKREYERQYDEAVDRLDRLVRKNRSRGATWRYDSRPDFDRARHVDLVGLVETLTGQQGVKAGATYRFHCPWHPDKTPSLTVYPPGKGWHCFSCTEGGSDAASFVARFKDVSQVEALRLVEEMCDVPGV